MSAPTYEAVARFAQQGGTIYFGVLFVICLAFALRPRQKATYDHLAALPLEGHEDDHVQS